MLNNQVKKTRMKVGKSVILILSAMLLIYAMLFGGPVAAADKVIKLRFSTGYSLHDPPTIQHNRTLDAIEKKTGGKINFDRFTGGVLGAVREQLELVSSGAVDLIGCHVDQYPQDLPLFSMIGSEHLVQGGERLNQWNKIRYEIPETKAILDAEEKKNNIKILSGYVQGTTGITTRLQAKSLADLNGKKVNVIAPFQRDIFADLGWIPVNVQVPELYEALSRGVIDSIFMATAAVLPLKWHEIGKVHLVFWEQQVINQPLAVNLDVWNSLPPDIKKIFEESSKEIAQWSIEGDKASTKATYDALKKANAVLTKLSNEDNIRFWEVYFKHGKEHNFKNAKNLGVLEEARVLYKYVDEMKWGSYKK